MNFAERQLAAKIRNGDPTAFRILYDQYASHLLGYLLRLTNSRTEAEDLLQETFLAAYTGRAGFQGRASLRSWLLGIATRRWRDRWRQKTPTPSSLEAWKERPGANRPGFAPPTAIETAVEEEITLAAALAALSPPHREALLLVRSQGLTYAEAAFLLEEPVGTVKWRVSEATKQLQQALATIDGEFHEMQRQPTGSDQLPCRR